MDELALSVEAFDVADGMYTAFDETGQRYELAGDVSVHGPVIDQGAVVATPATSPPDPAHLRTAILALLLERVGDVVRVPHLSLSTLVDAVLTLSKRV